MNNIDLSQVELAHLIKLCEADDMTNTVTSSLHAKATQALTNFQGDALSMPKPEPGRDTKVDVLKPDADPRTKAQQWRSPI